MQCVKQFPLQIVSVDSALVYRGMDIGTAKPTQQERQAAPHRLLDLIDPHENYSVAQFCQDAKQAIDEIIAQQQTPLLVGGTMMYFNALQQGISPMPEADPEIRQQIQQQAALEGWPAVHETLASIDAKSAAKIKPTDQQRLQRALEVYYLTGQTLSEAWQQRTQTLQQYQCLNIGLLPQDRAWLHQRIEKRLQHMFEQGFVDEVKQLYQRDELNASLPAMRTVGYRQVWQYLQGEYDLPTMQEKALFATRQLAKRQMTWLRHWPDCHYFAPEQAESVSLIEQLISKELPWN